MACKLLQRKKIEILEHSSIYETAPWGIENQDWFLNVALKIGSAMDPQLLLNACLEVEQQMGRKRAIKWGPRVIDIDILYYNDQIIQQANLSVPHPGIPDRRFTLLLLNEMMPKEKHPALKNSQAELLQNCQDQSECKITNLTLDIDLD